MTDARLRELQRQAHTLGDPEAQVALLRERARLGLDLGAVQVAALCGDEGWRAVVERLPESRASTQELADLFGVSASTVGAWCRDGCPHERRGRARAFDLGRVHRWRSRGAWSWTTQHGLEVWVAIVDRLAGPEAARVAVQQAVDLLRPRWLVTLGGAAQVAARETLACAQASPADLAALERALEALRAHVPTGAGSWASDAYQVLLPLRLLAEAQLAPPERALGLLRQAALSVVPALKPGPDTGPGCARDALEASRAGLERWALARIDAHDPLPGTGAFA